MGSFNEFSDKMRLQSHSSKASDNKGDDDDPEVYDEETDEKIPMPKSSQNTDNYDEEDDESNVDDEEANEIQVTSNGINL